MVSEDFQCPACGTAIRATGGSERLYRTDRDKNKVVPVDLEPFAEENPIDNDWEYLYYCPDDGCPVWRLFPGDWEGWE